MSCLGLDPGDYIRWTSSPTIRDRSQGTVYGTSTSSGERFGESMDRWGNPN